MRIIAKPNTVPTELKIVQNAVANDLLSDELFFL